MKITDITKPKNTGRNFIYPIHSVERVVDGDTFWAYLDLGFRDLALIEIRLAGIDTPEIRGLSEFEKKNAKLAKDATSHMLMFGKGDLWVQTFKDTDKYGRWLGIVWSESDTLTLNEYLVGHQLAVLSPDGTAKWRDNFKDESSLG